MRTIVVIQARQGSARLPGKSLRSLQGRPLIAHVIERAKALPSDGIVLATSDRALDDSLGVVAAHLGVPVVRGPERDVLQRVWLAAELSAAECIVRVTGDCPLLAPDVGEKVITAFKQHAYADYCWNDTAHSGYPDGTDVEVFTRAALNNAHKYATSDADREHVTLWMRRRCHMATVVSADDYSRLKLSVDTADDFERVTKIMARVLHGQHHLDATIRAAIDSGALEVA